MNHVYVFDVDGTLTESRSHIDLSFKKWLKSWMRNNNVFFVTGSDYEKTVEQVGSDVCLLTDAIFSCSGNSIMQKGKKIYTSPWSLNDRQITWLNDTLQRSMFTNKTGRHIEKRDGLVNFSIVGRNANSSERAQYVAYDRRTKERQKIADAFNREFNDVDAVVAGDTGIDITQSGKDKRQILKFFMRPDIHVTFFGDSIFPGGNDFPFAEALRESKPGQHKIVTVKSWKDTWKHLRNLEKINELIGV
jgi:HAD superfamily hydrolase (TIGR01484 family)